MKPYSIHLAAQAPAASLWTKEFLEVLEKEASCEVHSDCAAWTADRVLETCRAADVLMTGWGSLPLPPALAEDPGRLRYICHLTGTLRDIVPLALIRAGIPVTNWGDTPAGPVAEGALALLLACLHNLRPHIETKRAGGWVDPAWTTTLATMDGLRLGLYGFGVIGRKFAGLCLTMGAQMRVFDPYCRDLPEFCQRVDSLDELFATSHAVSVHAALTDSTRGSITARHLAMLPDGGLVINTARGALFDEPALFAELSAGRLRAGLDVLTTDEDPMPDAHPARHWPNVILTAHKISSAHWKPGCESGLAALHRVALDNLHRFRNGLPLRFQLDEERYALST